MKLKLHNYWRSSASYRVRIALAFKQIPYEYVSVSLLKGEQHQPGHRNKNPMGGVPVLEVIEGEKSSFIPQSLAIFEFLEEQYKSNSLLPSEAISRAHVRAVAETINSGIQPFHNLSTTAFLTDVLKADSKIWLTHFITNGLVALEKLAVQYSGKHMVGDSFSWADACLVPQLFGARRFVPTLDESQFPTLMRVEKAALELEAVRGAAPDKQVDAASI
jgi:maleylpyruvate isomerase